MSKKKKKKKTEIEKGIWLLVFVLEAAQTRRGEGADFHSNVWCDPGQVTLISVSPRVNKWQTRLRGSEAVTNLKQNFLI